MQDTDIYIKSDAGREEIRTRALHLPAAIRSILLIVDGQRSVAQFHDIIAGSKAPANTLETLLAQGLIEPRPDPTTSTIGGGMHESPAPDAMPALVATAPLAQPEPAPHPSPAALATAPLQEAAPVGVSRYYRLYAMMSEIVNDFLAPHRRFFIQLKIEKCSTAEELLELLFELHAALAKARGEAFAAELVARIRDAAN